MPLWSYPAVNTDSGWTALANAGVKEGVQILQISGSNSRSERLKFQKFAIQIPEIMNSNSRNDEFKFRNVRL